jgi:hypothetical protein
MGYTSTVTTSTTEILQPQDGWEMCASTFGNTAMLLWHGVSLTKDLLAATVLFEIEHGAWLTNCACLIIGCLFLDASRTPFTATLIRPTSSDRRYHQRRVI